MPARQTTLLSLSLLGLSALVPASAETYLAGGAYDYSDSSIYLAAGTDVSQRVSLHAQYLDAYEFVFRGTADIYLANGFSAIAGFSHYDYPSDDDTGTILGLGYKFAAGDVPMAVKGVKDTVGDGYYSFGVFAYVPLGRNLAIEASYKLNTDDVDNEMGLGVRFRF